jgi:xanthine dehydrogenase accessory factor
MRHHLDLLKKWFSDGKAAVMVRVIKTWGSSPRPVGSVMLINEDGQLAGSVSGGCIEGAVVKKAKELFNNHQSKKIEFGVTDEEAWTVGLSCGGRIEVFLQSLSPSDPIWHQLIHEIEANHSTILVTSLNDGNTQNSLLLENDKYAGNMIAKDLKAVGYQALEERINKLIEWHGQPYFIHLFPRKPQLLIIGAAHITVDLVSLANLYGFETVVIDPRGYFIENTVFIEPPSKLINAYPSEVFDDFRLDAYTYAVILSHDPKIDDNALEVLLPSKVAYIGALGSKKTHAKRVNRLMEKGFKQDVIDRIQAPIGLSIKAKTPQEIALSIMGQIIETKNKFS